MTDQHRATPEQWALDADTAVGCMSATILELRARIEALDAAQLEQAESNRFCTDAIVRRVEALEAHDKQDATCWTMVRSGMHALRERVEALEAAPQDKLDRDDQTPDAAMTDYERVAANLATCPSIDRIPDFTGASPTTPELRTARLPKPPSLKEQALADLDEMQIAPCVIDGIDINAAVREKYDAIRHALQLLPDDTTY